MKLSMKIIAFFCTIAMFSSLLFVPVSAVDTGTSSLSTVDFWDTLALRALSSSQNAGEYGHVFEWFASKVSENACQNSDDNLHHGKPVRITGGGRSEYSAVCVCDYCGKEFNATITRDELQSAYDSYVDSLQATYGSTIFNDDGTFWWFPDFTYGCVLPGGSSSQAIYFGNTDEASAGSLFSLSWSAVSSYSGSLYASSNESNGYSEKVSFRIYYNGLAPCNGYYQLCGIGTYGVGGSYRDRYNAVDTVQVDYPSASAATYYPVGSVFNSFKVLSSVIPASKYVVSMNMLYSTPGYLVTPLSLLDMTSGALGTTTRPTSITGDYGIIGDDGTITKVDGNVIFDESTSTIYNPVTNTTYNVTNWTYDYSDRSYTCTTDNSQTITITYGDENVTINEGDTIYNVYYVTEGSGSGSGTTDPSGSGSTDPSGSGGTGDESESVWDKLGSLIGSLLGGILEVAEAVISKVLEYLEALVTLINEKIGAIVTAILGLLDYIPSLFSGFTGFLTAVFPFLPQELFDVLLLGACLLAVSAIIRFFLKR